MGVRERTAERGEERESDENASSYAERHRCLAVLFFSRVPASFALFLLLLSFTVELLSWKNMGDLGCELLYEFIVKTTKLFQEIC